MKTLTALHLQQCIVSFALKQGFHPWQIELGLFDKDEEHV